MQLARVVGTVVATIKDPTLVSRRLLVIQPIAASGAAIGAPLVALDSVGVGAGEEVMFVKGREAAFAVLAPMSGIGLMALYGARYGRFPAKDEPAGEPDEGDAPGQ